jgi:hypothetical protein
MLALKRKKEKREVFSEIETKHPGYLVAQDTYYVGNIKGEAGFISRPLLIRTPELPLLMFMIVRMLWLQLICLMVKCCLSSKNKLSHYIEF